MRDDDGSVRLDGMTLAAPRRHGDVPARDRRRRPRPRDHARDPRVRPPPERAGAAAHRPGARRRAARGHPPRAPARRGRQEALEAPRPRLGRRPAGGGDPGAAVRAYLDELGLPAHDVRLDRARLGRLAIDAIAAMPTRSSRRRRGRRSGTAARCAARGRWSRRGRSAGRSLDPDAGRAAARGAADARAVRRASRGAPDAGRGGRARDRARAEGGRRRPARAAARAHGREPRAGAVDGRRWLCRATSRSRVRRLAGVELSAGRVAALRSRDAPVRHADRHARRAAAATRADRDVRLRPDRLSARAHRQRAAVRRLHVARALAARRGHDVRLVHNITDVNDKIYEAAPGQSAERAVEATRWYLEDTAGFGLGMPDAQPLATETMPEIVSLIEELIAPDTRTRSTATSTSASLASRGTARCPGSGPIRWRSRSRTRQGGSSRLRALEGDEGG